MIVLGVAILTVAAGIAARRRHRSDTGSHTRIAQTNARVVHTAVALWRVERDPRVCPTLDDLYRDGVLDRSFPATDPWGTPWHIECPGPPR